jgi:hypothetical protein
MHWATYLPSAEPLVPEHTVPDPEFHVVIEPPPLLPHPPAPPAPQAGAKRPAEGPRISLSVTCILSFSDCRFVSFHSVSYQRLSLCVVSFCLLWHERRSR